MKKNGWEENWRRLGCNTYKRCFWSIVQSNQPKEDSYKRVILTVLLHIYSFTLLFFFCWYTVFSAYQFFLQHINIVRCWLLILTVVANGYCLRFSESRIKLSLKKKKKKKSALTDISIIMIAITFASSGNSNSADLYCRKSLSLSSSSSSGRFGNLRLKPQSNLLHRNAKMFSKRLL